MECRLRVFENGLFRRIFGPKRDEIIGEWRKLHNEELSYMYSSPKIVRVRKSRIIRWTGHVARMGEKRGDTGFWWGNLRESDHLGDPGLDGRVILRWIWGCGGMDWIELAQDRDKWRALLNAVMNLRLPLNAGNFCSR